jgi:hypothetical protein
VKDSAHLAFVSARSGLTNLEIVDLENNRISPITNILSGVFTPISLPMAITWLSQITSMVPGKSTSKVARSWTWNIGITPPPLSIIKMQTCWIA